MKRGIDINRFNILMIFFVGVAEKFNHNNIESAIMTKMAFVEKERYVGLLPKRVLQSHSINFGTKYPLILDYPRLKNTSMF